MFEEQDDDDEEKETKKFLKKRHGVVSLAEMLNDDHSDGETTTDSMDVNGEPGNKSNRSHTSIYIENTDSEDE